MKQNIEETRSIMELMNQEMVCLCVCVCVCVWGGGGGGGGVHVHAFMDLEVNSLPPAL